MPKIYAIPFFLLFYFPALFSQKPFTCKGQLFLAMTNNKFALHEITINAQTGVAELQPIEDDLPVNINAIGFRRSDNLIYGWNYVQSQLFRLDAEGVVENLKQLALTPGVNYWGGDVTPNGKFLVLIGGINGAVNQDMELAIIDLSSPDYDFVRIAVANIFKVTY